MISRHAALVSLFIILVLSLTACAGSDGETPAGGQAPEDAPGETTPETGGQTPEEEEPVETGEETGATGGQEVTIEASDEFRFEPAELTVKAGEPVEITLNNAGALEHDITWEETDETLVKAEGGGSEASTHTFDEPGEHEFYCSVPGHKEAGMVGVVTVTE